MTDDSFTKFFRHTMSMMQLTEVELVNTYWQQAHKIAEMGKLAFIIRGNAAWESERPEGVDDGKGLWLKSNRYEPVGKHIAEEPVRTYLQWYMNIYEIWGKITIDINPNDASASKPLIGQALEKATCITNTMSLLNGASLRWYPARYEYIRHEPMPLPPERTVTESWVCLPLPRSQDEQTCTVLRDEHILNELLPLANKVEALPSTLQTMIKTAIDWHAHGNRYTSGLNSFVNYWESIELLGHFFYTRLPASVVQGKAKTEKKDMIINLLKDVTRDNCMDVVGKCNEIRMPTARTKVLAFLDIITDRGRMEALLFEPDDKTGKSLYQIRNDIAHGNLSEHHFETIESFSHRLFDAQKISRQIILLSIENAEKLT
jgi:hypothetical protein